MPKETDDLRILSTEELLPPEKLINEIPPSSTALETVAGARGAIHDILVLSNRHSELNNFMIPRKKEDNSKYLMAPMPGLLVSILVQENQEIEENQPLAVIEAMKMENIIKSPTDGTIQKLHVEKGNNVEKNQVLISF